MNIFVSLFLNGKALSGKLKSIIFYLLLLLLFPALCQAQNLLDAPQKIVIDYRRDRLLVSNYNSGRLVAIDNSGSQSTFIQYSDIIDGMEIVGDTVYGAGMNRRLKAYNLITKQPVFNLLITGNLDHYLSSITSDSSGHLFISSPPENAIYKFRIKDRRFWIFAKDNGLNKPNGILLERDKNRIVVIDDSPNSKIHAISLADSSVSTLASTTFYNPDGIVRDKNGYYYAAGYYLDGIYKFDPSFSQAPVKFADASSYVYPTYDAVNNSLIVASYNNNTWTRIPIGATDVGKKEVPKNYTLFQNYPNPFNPVTIIKYTIPETPYMASLPNVTLKVFDLLGREIAKPVDGNKPAGIHSYQFDGSNIPSGIYFYQLIAGNYTERRKMVLLK